MALEVRQRGRSESGLRSLQLPSGTQLEAVKKSAKVAADQQGRQLPRVGATFWAPFGPVYLMFIHVSIEALPDDGRFRHPASGRWVRTPQTWWRIGSP